MALVEKGERKRAEGESGRGKWKWNGSGMGLLLNRDSGSGWLAVWGMGGWWGFWDAGGRWSKRVDGSSHRHNTQPESVCGWELCKKRLLMGWLGMREVGGGGGF